MKTILLFISIALVWSQDEDYPSDMERFPIVRPDNVPSFLKQFHHLMPRNEASNRGNIAPMRPEREGVRTMDRPRSGPAATDFRTDTVPVNTLKSLRSLGGFSQVADIIAKTHRVAFEITKPYVDPNSKYDMPPSDVAVVEEPAVDVEPVMEDNQPEGDIEPAVDVELVTGDSQSEGDIEPDVIPADSTLDELPEEPADAPEGPPEPRPMAKPTPKLKPSPKAKPAPVSSVGDGPSSISVPKVKPTPVGKPKPIPKERPRSLLSFLGFGGPGLKPSPKSKPSPKAKPSPKVKPNPALSDSVARPIEGAASSTVSGGKREKTLRAEISLLSTPHSADYEDEAYIAVSTVQDMCSRDYTQMCSPYDSFMAPSHVSQSKPGALRPSEFDIVRPSLYYYTVHDDDAHSYDDGSYYDDFINERSDVLTWGPNENSMFNLADVMFSLFNVQPFVMFEFAPAGDEEYRPESGVLTESESTQTTLRKLQTSSQSVPDASFLGFGSSGDKCLLEQYDELSPECQSAIDDALTLREEYLEEETTGHCHGVFAVLLVGLAIVCLCGCVRHSQRSKLNKTLQAIHSNAQLKEQIESASGVPVPPVRNCNARKCGRRVVRVLIALVVSFLLVRLAAQFTLMIVNRMVYVDEDNNEVVPSPLVVLLVFISMLLSELMVVLAIKNIVEACRQRSARSTTTPVNNATTGTSTPPPENFNMNRLVPSLPTFTRSVRVSNPFSRSAQYEPLLTDEETEMVESNVVASAPMEHGHHVVYVPPTAVTAQSMSSVSML